jgi:hypothetical protein
MPRDEAAPTAFGVDRCGKRDRRLMLHRYLAPSGGGEVFGHSACPLRGEQERAQVEELLDGSKIEHGIVLPVESVRGVTWVNTCSRPTARASDVSVGHCDGLRLPLSRAARGCCRFAVACGVTLAG